MLYTFLTAVDTVVPTAKVYQLQHTYRLKLLLSWLKIDPIILARNAAWNAACNDFPDTSPAVSTILETHVTCRELRKTMGATQSGFHENLDLNHRLRG